MIKFLAIFALFVLQAFPVNAQTVTPATYWGGSGSTSFPDTQLSPEAQCKAHDEKYSYYYGNQVTYDSNGTHAVCKVATNSTQTTWSIAANLYLRTCGSTTPYWDESLHKCVATAPPPANPCSDKNPIIRRYNYGPSGPYTSPDNFAGCKVVVEQMLTCGKDAQGLYCFWQVHRTGDVYTGSDNTATGGGSVDTSAPPVGATPVPSPPIKPPAPESPEICASCVPCPKGTVQAGISADGIPMCVGTGTNPPPAPVPPPTTTKPSTTTTNADGSTTTRQDTVQTNSDGSTTTTTTTTTTAPDGTKTTTVGASTTNATSGAPGRTDAPQDDKYNLCKQNPTLSICRESSVNGTCGQITCTGDAIQCATLRAAAAMECKQRADEDAIKSSSIHAKGLAAVNGTDPDAATLPTTKNASVVQMGTMSDSGWIGGGSAFSDVSFTVQGKAFVVPLNKWSGYLVGLRYALMVVAMLVSFRMLSGVILRD